MAWRDHRCVRLVCVLLLLGSLIGCTNRIGDLTVISTKNVGQLAQKGDRVQAEDCSSSFLFFPLSGNMQPNLKTAIDRALEKTKGDVLVEAVISHSAIFTYIYNEFCFKVEGNGARAELGKK